MFDIETLFQWAGVEFNETARQELIRGNGLYSFKTFGHLLSDNNAAVLYHAFGLSTFEIEAHYLACKCAATKY